VRDSATYYEGLALDAMEVARESVNSEAVRVHIDRSQMYVTLAVAAALDGVLRIER
jgi:hypothetical protein